MTLPSPTLKSLKRLALIVLLLFGASDGADALVEVGLLTWSRDPQTEKIIAGLAERIKDLHGEVLLLRRDSDLSEERFERHMEEFRSRQVASVVVMGDEAARRIHRDRWWSHFPVVASAISDPGYLGLDESSGGLPEMTGVVASLPLASQLALLKYLFPVARTVGFIYNRPVAEVFFSELPNLDLAEPSLGLDVKPLPIEDILSGPDLFQRRTNGLDAFIIAAGQSLLEEVPDFRQWVGSRPLFALSEEAVSAGAVAALYADQRRLGWETALKVRALLDGARASSLPYRPCPDVRLAVNLASARRVGITVPQLLMVEPASVWRSSNGRRWYGRDGGLLPETVIENDPESRTYRSLSLICSCLSSCRPFIEGVIDALRQSRNNYRLSMVDGDGSIEAVSQAFREREAKSDLTVVVGPLARQAAQSLPCSRPVVFTGAAVTDEDYRSSSSSWGGSSDLLPAGEYPPLLESLFGRHRTFILVLPLSSGKPTEADALYREMALRGLDTKLLPLKSRGDDREKAELIYRSLAAAAEAGGDPVLVVPAMAEAYRSLPDLGAMMGVGGRGFPVFVTSSWVQEFWGGTVAPDVAPEAVGLAAGKYVIQILEQGAETGDLPLWTPSGTRSIRLHRRWRDLSRWVPPAEWGGGTREVIVEGDRTCR